MRAFERLENAQNKAREALLNNIKNWGVSMEVQVDLLMIDKECLLQSTAYLLVLMKRKSIVFHLTLHGRNK
ncbi:MAG: hypothetical protein SFU91_00650 [Chloroherpetonaceae bacterium]|nr:hypothetical protein [Chloroherpetonaceae bacterium]